MVEMVRWKSLIVRGTFHGDSDPGRRGVRGRHARSGRSKRENENPVSAAGVGPGTVSGSTRSQPTRGTTSPGFQVSSGFVFGGLALLGLMGLMGSRPEIADAQVEVDEPSDCSRAPFNVIVHNSPISAAGHQLPSVFAGLLTTTPTDVARIEVATPAGQFARASVWYAIVSNEVAPASDSDSGVQFWSLSIACSGDAVIVGATTSGTAGAEAPDGVRVDGFEHTQIVDPSVIHPSSGEPQGWGVVSAVLTSTSGPMTLAPRGTATVLRIDIEATSSQGLEPLHAQLVCHDGLTGAGQPVSNMVVVDSASQIFCSCQRTEVIFVPANKSSFVRGDANGDAEVDLSDAIFVLDWLFNGAREPSCREAVDIDSSEFHDVSDVISILGWLFLGGTPPTPPFPHCGPGPETSSCISGSCDS
jgi:hypothetical protein